VPFLLLFIALAAHATDSPVSGLLARNLCEQMAWVSWSAAPSAVQVAGCSGWPSASSEWRRHLLNWP
jgi:hypothetical protein